MKLDTKEPRSSPRTALTQPQEHLGSCSIESRRELSCVFPPFSPFYPREGRSLNSSLHHLKRERHWAISHCLPLSCFLHLQAGHDARCGPNSYFGCSDVEMLIIRLKITVILTLDRDCKSKRAMVVVPLLLVVAPIVGVCHLRRALGPHGHNSRLLKINKNSRLQNIKHHRSRTPRSLPRFAFATGAAPV